MGKRSDFKRRKNDLYETWDPRALPPLLPHLKKGAVFDEPCAGAGRLSDQLEQAGMMPRVLSDIDPLDRRVMKCDAFQYAPDPAPDYIITNPPWSRDLLHPLIAHFSNYAPTWLLFDAAWAFTSQSRMHKRGLGSVPEIMRRCVKIVTVGRLKWIEGSEHDAKDDVAWYLFDCHHSGAPPQFFPKLQQTPNLKEIKHHEKSTI